MTRAPAATMDFHLSTDKIEVFVRREVAAAPTLVFSLRGRLDYYNAGAFLAFVRGHLAPGPLWVILDLAGLIHLASSGINALAELADEVARLPGEFAVVSVPPVIRQGLALLGLEEKLAVFPSLKDAFDDLGQPQRHRKFRPLFPALLPCPSCSRRLQASRPGKYRCGTCKMPFEVDDQARIRLV
ncbi:MAG TPA: STAS domain-containing protein [Spirochaetia bacterium]|nr:STAS domain-containing protein [Spirochaetia bacterium]